jgi:hypothetical protein
MEGIAVEIQGLGVNASDRIALLGENKTCGVDEGGSVLGLRVGGLQATAPFEKWEPKVIKGGGIGQYFSRVEGRACPADEKKGLPISNKYKTDPEGNFTAYLRLPDTKNAKLRTTCEYDCNAKGKNCKPCPLEKCLRDCFNEMAHICAAVTVSRTGSGCSFYSSVCSMDTAKADPAQDTYFKRWEVEGSALDVSLLESNLTRLSFAPVALTHNRGAALKVCFCDSVLHPTCSTPADFDVELGRLHISGAMCQAVRPLAATHDCRHQDYSGLACTPKPPVQESGRSIEMVSPATVTVAMSSTFVLSESDLSLLESFPATMTFGLLNGLANGLGVSKSAIKITGTETRDRAGGLSSLTVDYSVTGDSAVASTLDSFVDGEQSLVASVSAAIEAALASQSLDGLLITSVNSSSSLVGGATSTNTSRI